MLSRLQHLLFQYRKKLTWLFVVMIAVIPLFVNLDLLPLRTYDESRLANNAYEMYKSGNYWVTTFNGLPDLWNTKPPFFIWIQVFFITVFGYSEVALRLPSALAGLFICLTLIRFSKLYLNAISIGYIAVIVLVSSSGFLCLHGTRTGDYDAMTALFMLLYSLCFFLYLENKSVKFFYAFGILLSFSVLTKSVVGLMFLPGLALYVLFGKHLLSLLKDKHFYIVAFISSGIIGAFYIYREILSPGFLDAVATNELGGRFLNTIEEHLHPFSYYYDNITKNHFNHWYLLLILGFFIGLTNNDKRISRISQLSIAIILSYLFIISISQTKLEWYALPIYPFMALLTALAMHEIMKFLGKLKLTKSFLSFEILPFLFLIVVAYEPYRKVLKSTFRPTEKKYEIEYYQISYFLKSAVAGNYDLNGYLLTDLDYHPQTKAYLYMLNEKGVNLREKDYFKLESNDKAIVHQDSVKNYINRNYIFEENKLFKNVALYHIKGLKNGN